MSSMLDILKNFDAAEKGDKPAGPAEVGSMKAILESFQAVDECGEMPMQAPAAQEQPVTVSITASGKDNVDELMAILKGAGVEQHVDMPMAHDAHIDTDSHNDQEMDMATMRRIMAASDDEGEVEEAEWDNSPDEEYGSEDDVIPDGDDLHRPKDRKAIRTNDPALESLADSLKSDLRKALEEKMCSSKKKSMKTKEGERHGNDSMYDKCWDGYERVPGKKRGEKGSCRKK